jgi:hypothetical protein
MAAIANVKCNDLSRLGVHNELNPLLVRFILHKATPLVSFHLQHHVLARVIGWIFR